MTDPFGRQAYGDVHGEDTIADTLRRAVEDILPTTLVAKMIGVAICLPAVFGSAVESE